MTNKMDSKNLLLKITTTTIIFTLIVLSSGCIHIELGNPFKKPEEKITDYTIVTKQGFPLKHVFNTEEGDIRYGDTQPFFTKKGTEWVNISIVVVINNYQIINGSPINISFLEQFVKISLKGPDNEVYYNDKFTETTELLWPLNAPDTGRWIVSVDAQGYGFSDSYDYYEINVVSYEPV